MEKRAVENMALWPFASIAATAQAEPVVDRPCKACRTDVWRSRPDAQPCATFEPTRCLKMSSPEPLLKLRVSEVAF